MSELTSHERVLFVHAHPDDETLATGGTIATLIDAGAEVVLLTLTRGERGEVIPPELAHLADDPQALGEHRERELAEAARALGIRDHRFLGDAGARLAGREPRRYRDTGMVWLEGQPFAGAPSELDPQSLLAADYGELVTDVATVVAEVHPTAIVSYDTNGGYGHPDHVLAHDAASHAAEVLGVPYFAIVDPVSGNPNVVRVDVTRVLDRKRAALTAHRTQLSLEGDTIVHSGGQRHPIGTVEAFERRRAVEAPVVSLESFGTGMKAAGGVLAVVAGAVVAGLGTVNHQYNPWGDDGDVSFGVIASLALAAILLVGLRLVTRGRWLALLAGAAMVVVVALMATVSQGGSVLIPDNTAGVSWAYGVPVLFAIVIGWPRIERHAEPATAGPPRYDELSRPAKGRASA